mgnify:CR=1 FL=1
MSQVMYVGPNVQKLGLLRNQVYLDGIPGQVKAAIALYPEIESLIVPIEDITEAITKTRTKGEHLHHIYSEIERKAGVK